MSKEMYISSSPHETKVAVLEDDQLVEVYFERDTDVGLVGGFIRDASAACFPACSRRLSISASNATPSFTFPTFYEDQEEYDKVFEEAEARATKFTENRQELPTRCRSRRPP